MASEFCCVSTKPIDTYRAKSKKVAQISELHSLNISPVFYFKWVDLHHQLLISSVQFWLNLWHSRLQHVFVQHMFSSRVNEIHLLNLLFEVFVQCRNGVGTSTFTTLFRDKWLVAWQRFEKNGVILIIIFFFQHPTITANSTYRTALQQRNGDSV